MIIFTPSFSSFSNYSVKLRTLSSSAMKNPTNSSLSLSQCLQNFSPYLILFCCSCPSSSSLPNLLTFLSMTLALWKNSALQRFPYCASFVQRSFPYWKATSLTNLSWVVQDPEHCKFANCLPFRDFSIYPCNQIGFWRLVWKRLRKEICFIDYSELIFWFIGFWSILISWVVWVEFVLRHWNWVFWRSWTWVFFWSHNTRWKFYLNE